MEFVDCNKDSTSVVEKQEIYFYNLSAKASDDYRLIPLSIDTDKSDFRSVWQRLGSPLIEGESGWVTSRLCH